MEQNEDVVKQALKHTKNCLELCSKDEVEDKLTSLGIKFRKCIDIKHGAVRIYPQDNDTNGFFIAMFKRCENNALLHSLRMGPK